jgi:mono/diheme cytochrome c family protein
VRKERLTDGFNGTDDKMISRFVFRFSQYAVGMSLALAASSAAAADASQGEQLARRWCSSCHVVAADQSGGVIEAPPFQTIARRADFSAPALALFLLDPHPKMPDMGLSREAAADLAAYIASLK